MNLIVNVVILTIPWLLILTLCNSQTTTKSTENEESLKSDAVANGRPTSNFTLKNDTSWKIPFGRYAGMTNEEYIAYVKKKRYDRLRKMLPFAHDLTRNPLDCYLLMPKVNTSREYFTPLIFTSDTVDGKILHPDMFGVINIKKHSFFQLSCPGSNFNMPSTESAQSEISVRCLRKEFIKFKGKVYKFSNFSCLAAPKATIMESDTPCQGNNKLLEVGFQTVEHFIKLYRICFDSVRQNPIYSWYVRRRPVSRHRQTVRWFPEFNSSLRYHGINVAQDIYNFSHVKNIVQSTVNSTFLANQYLHVANKRFLKQKDLTSNQDFHFLFEQYSSFFSENSVPHWITFSNIVWKDVERSFRYDIARGEHRHTVLTGTYLTATLRDSQQVEHELYLNPPNRIPVPLYVWKMDYNIDMGVSIVYVGLNNPYVDFSDLKPICEKTPCRKSLKVRKKYNKKFLYCCTKESFEKTYGTIDPIVYEEYM